MSSKFCYLFACPADALTISAVNSKMSVFGSGSVEESWQRYPRLLDEDGNVTFPEPAQYYISGLIPFYEFINEGYRSKEALESALSDPEKDLALDNLLWWRVTNPFLPGDTGTADGGILLAKHNSAAGTIGETWGRESVISTLMP